MKEKSYSIYLDYAAATPLDASAEHIMVKSMRQYYANASAIHRLGVLSKSAIENARAEIAKLIFAHSDEITFTGSGSESNALAILGVVAHHRLSTKKNRKNILPHIITSSIEHPSVLENCKMLEERREAEVTYIKPDARGILDPKEIKTNLKATTILVSIMYANNEIGTIQPITEIAKVIRHFRKMKAERSESISLYFHTDACQAMNYLPTENIEQLGVDLMTWNSSKIYGPKGIGFLYKKRSCEITPLYKGGGQEFDLRPGTEDVVSILGAAQAFTETNKIKNKESARLLKIRDYGIAKLLDLSKTTGRTIMLNGDEALRLPNNINISISNISSELLVIELDAKGIAVSAKSACKSDEPDESYVINAIREAGGLTGNSTDGSLRISLGRGTTKKDMDVLTQVLKNILLKYNHWNLS